MKQFDLNIEKVLEDWETYHAIREIIANALDERLLTKTKDIQISRDEKKCWHIRDFGRGLRYEHLTQNENEEKLQNQNLIGKFGVGLKDALATFDRRGIKVIIKSQYGDITLGKSKKHEFDDIITLHAYISHPSDSSLVGTEFILDGCLNEDIENAKNLFHIFSGERIIENTQYGEILEKVGSTARIFINGVMVSDEDNFLFSYNITSLTKTLKKALNRERSNVGRSAYSDRVKAILLDSKKEEIMKKLADDLKEYGTGRIHDELKWTDVSTHATKILNASDNVVFFTPSELANAPDAVDRAKDDGFEIITVPDNVRDRIKDETDLSGNPIRDLDEYTDEWNESFEFNFVNLNNLSRREKNIFQMTDKILKLIGGKPENVKIIKISETMRLDTFRMQEAVGIYDKISEEIIIKRTQLNSLRDYAGTLLHEVAHAISGASDISSEFEKCLTELLGRVASNEDIYKKNDGFLSKFFRS